MTVAAGIDVGNATTEVVLGRLHPGRVEVLGAGRAPTRRAKGSPESLAGAVTLLRRLERQHGVTATVATSAPLRPVETATASVPEPRPELGRLRLAAASARTAGGEGFGAGRPVPFGAPVPGTDDVVVVVPTGVGYDRAVAGLAGLESGGRLVAVVLEDDEAVLVANRLRSGVPVVDQVDAATVLDATRVAVEVSRGSRPLQVLTDPLKLATALGLPEEEQPDAARLAPLLFDASNAVVTLGARHPKAAGPERSGWIELREQGRLPFPEAHRHVRDGPVGTARAYTLADDAASESVDDLWTADLTAVAASVGARRLTTATRPFGLAALRSADGYVDPSSTFGDLLGVPVLAAASEAVAARAGALSTPGAGRTAAVVDLGGGTIDAVTAGVTVVAAGAGDLLTQCVAALTGTTAAAAEWVKRGPAHRVETPQLLLGEDGARRFLARPASSDVVGALVVDGPAGLLPFSRTSAPGEWRALRSRLKAEVIGGNVARALRGLDAVPGTVLAVGGVAGDEEILAAVSAALPAGTAVARGDVAGALGHRYAVAYGLLELAATAGKPRLA